MATARVAPIQPKVQQQPDSLHAAIEAYYWLLCFATTEVSVPRFTVKDLLNLRIGTVVQTASRVADEVPIRLNKVLLGRGQFEVVENRLAIRITELA